MKISAESIGASAGVVRQFEPLALLGSPLPRSGNRGAEGG